MTSYVVIGKFSEIDSLTLLNKNIDKNLKNLNCSKRKVAKVLIISSLAILTSVIVDELGLTNLDAFAYSEAIEVNASYKEPTQLRSILSFIDWMVFMVRWVVSSIIGLIATYAGYKWSTDISGNGVSEAKKILKNCAIGLFWVHFGSIIANFFVDKISSFI